MNLRFWITQYIYEGQSDSAASWGTVSWTRVIDHIQEHKSMLTVARFPTFSARSFTPLEFQKWMTKKFSKIAVDNDKSTRDSAMHLPKAAIKMWRQINLLKSVRWWRYSNSFYWLYKNCQKFCLCYL